MIDLHCHLLPAIDDGPASEEEALELARYAVNNGITQSLLTPHIHPGRYENDKQGIAVAVDNFRSLLQEHEIPLRIAMGAEVRICPEILPMVKMGLIPFIGKHQGMKVMLLEFPHSNLPIGSDKMVAWLKSEGIVPMIAHPERNKELMQNPDKIAAFIEMGCLLQVTASSVAGHFGPAAQQCARYYLEQDWVHILASDAHNLEYRSPNLEPGRAAAAEFIGEEASWRLVRDNPQTLSADCFA